MIEKEWERRDGHMKKMIKKYGIFMLQGFLSIVPFAAVSASQICRFIFNQPEEPEGFEQFARSKWSK